MLVTPKKRIALALGINDISHDVRWLPFRKAYQLAPGVHDAAMDPPRDVALLTMELDGRLARHAIPAGLVRQLDALHPGAPAEMIATRAGDLVIQPGAAASGGGLYLVQGEQSRRIWCTTRPASGQASGADGCTMSQAVAVSPDGCRIAFDARAGHRHRHRLPGVAHAEGADALRRRVAGHGVGGGREEEKCPLIRVDCGLWFVVCGARNVGIPATTSRAEAVGPACAGQLSRSLRPAASTTALRCSAPRASS